MFSTLRRRSLNSDSPHNHGLSLPHSLLFSRFGFKDWLGGLGLINILKIFEFMENAKRAKYADSYRVRCRPPHLPNLPTRNRGLLEAQSFDKRSEKPKFPESQTFCAGA